MKAILKKTTEVMPVLFAVFAVIWLLYFIITPFNGQKTDFPQYYAPARMIVTGHGSEIYNFEKGVELQNQLFPSMGGRMQPVYLPPPSQAWMIPLGLLPGDIAYIVWKTMQLVCLCMSVWLLKSCYQLSKKATAWLVAVLFASGPAFMACSIDQVSLFLLGALCVAIWGLKKDNPWVAAVALAFLMLKPQEAFPLLAFLLGAQRYKPVFRALGIVAVLSIIVSSIIGYQSVIDYFKFASTFVEQNAFLQSELGPNLRGQLLRFAPDSKALIATVSSIVCLLGLGFIFVSGRRFSKNPEWLEAGLLIAVPLGLVTMFYVHSYELVLLAPALLVILSGPLEATIPPALLMLGFLLVGTLMIPFYILIHHYYLLEGHGLLNPHFFAVLYVAFGATILAYRCPDKIQS